MRDNKAVGGDKHPDPDELKDAEKVTLARVKTLVDEARTVDPAILDTYEGLDAYKARINAITRADRTAEAVAYRESGNIEVHPPETVFAVQRASELRTATVGNPEAGPLHAEYMEYGYTYDEADDFLKAGYPPAFVVAVMRGTLRKEITARKREISRDAKDE